MIFMKKLSKPFSILSFLFILLISVTPTQASPILSANQIAKDYEQKPVTSLTGIMASYPPDPAANISWSAGTSGVSDIQTAYNNARATENAQLGKSIPMLSLPAQATWDSMTDGEKALWLINRERIDRGVMPLEGLEENVSSIAQYYADYLLANNAWGHDADGFSPWERLQNNPAIGACQDFLSVAENLHVSVASTNSIPLPIERAIFDWMYADGSSWGHRHMILWYPYNDNSGDVGKEGFLGIGRASGGPYTGTFSSSWNYAEIIVMNVFDPCSAWSASVQDVNETTGAGGPDTTGVFRPSNGLLYLKNQNMTGYADVAINYGTGGDYPVTGDWDGDGTDTIGIYRNGSFYLRNSNKLGFADLVFAFGTPGDQPVAGDWNGDGIDTIGVYRPSTGQFLLRNSNTAGSPQMSFFLGNVGDVGISGDWNGDGVDTTGVFRPSNGVIFLKNANSTGFADVALNYGSPGDRPVMGDWDNDGIDTIGVYRNGIFYLRNSNTIGFADLVFGLGNPGDMPIAGDWNGQP